MADPKVAQLHAWLAEHESALLDDHRTLPRFPSLEADALPGAPFGQANRDALDWMLEKAASAGIATKDLDGFCGYAESGPGERMIMSLGHLDVVPVGTGWNRNPLEPRSRTVMCMPAAPAMTRGRRWRRFTNQGTSVLPSGC